MTAPVSQSQFLAALDDLIARETLLPLEPDDITVPRLTERAKIDHKTARRWLAKWVAEGVVELLGDRRNDRGATVRAWRCK